MEKAYLERAGLLVYLQVEPIFDSLRSDVRFADLLRRLQFPPLGEPSIVVRAE